MREEKHTDMSLTDEQLALIGVTSLSMPEQYIQVKDARYTLDEFNRIGELLLGRNLTDDQQVVLEWLKDGDNSPIAMIGTLDDDFLGIDTGSLIPTKVREGFEKLTDTQQFQVLAAFAEWGIGTLDN